MVEVLKSAKVRVLNLEFETLHRIGETEDFIYFANRMGNGNEASGDGWKYRGKGFI